jgi:replication fork clamp-binding protein CrfC
MKNVDLSELPPALAHTVRAFRAELIAEREEQERRLHEAFDRLKREVEIEIAVFRRLTEIFKLQSDDMAAPN